MANETSGKEEIAGINNPHLAAAASDSVAIVTSKLLTDFDNLSSAVGLALNPSFLFPILSRTAWRFSPKLRDKIRDGKPGFKVTGGGCMLTLTRK